MAAFTLKGVDPERMDANDPENALGRAEFPVATRITVDGGLNSPTSNCHDDLARSDRERVSRALR